MSIVIKKPQALRDIEELAFYLGQVNRATGFRFLQKLEEAFEKLAGMPEMGSLWEFNNAALAGLRFWMVRGFRKHLVFYRPLDEGIDVIRVLHSSRDIERMLDDSEPNS